MLKTAIPELHVSNSLPAKDFYSRLGFECVSSWGQGDPSYMAFVRDGVRLHVTSFRDGAIGASVYVDVDDVDGLYAEFVAKGIQTTSPPVDQTWGTREIVVRDADGNSIRFGQAQPSN